MQTFTVHEPPNAPADRVDRAESLLFIKDGFSWGAALFGPLWLLAHRLWWPLIGYIIAYGAIECGATDEDRRSTLDRALSPRPQSPAGL